MVGKCVVLSFYDLLDRNQVDCGFDIKVSSQNMKTWSIFFRKRLFVSICSIRRTSRVENYTC